MGHLNPEYLTDIAEKLHEIAAGTEELTKQHVVFNGEVKRKATIVQIAANLLRAAAFASGEAAAPRQVEPEFRDTASLPNPNPPAPHSEEEDNASQSFSGSDAQERCHEAPSSGGGCE